VALSVTVVPADHLEWQPPHMVAVTVSWSPVFTEKIREPESSMGEAGATDGAAVLVFRSGALQGNGDVGHGAIVACLRTGWSSARPVCVVAGSLDPPLPERCHASGRGR
jgi:hypothetical protein